jgi:hypothetical protein
LFLVLAAELSAQTWLELGPAAGASVGNTTYQLDLYDGGLGIVSQLEFPVDAYHAGGEAGVSMGDLRVHGAFHAAFTDPRRLMKDHDWLKIVNGPGLKWSYTESPVEHTEYLAAVHFAYRLFRIGAHEIWASAGYRYQYVYQEIIGYEGWQFDLETYQGVEFSADDVLAGVYRIHLHQPMVGLGYGFVPVPGVELRSELSYILLLERDYDNHVLRNKESSSFGAGNGVSGRLSVSIAPFRVGATRPFLRVSGDGLFGVVSTTSTQRWYGDDPATPNEDDTGSVARDLPHTVYTMQASATVTLGVRIRLGGETGGAP